MVASVFTVPNVKNPISDILPNYGGSSPGTGTFAGPGDTVSSGNAPIQSCIVGGLVGAATFGLIGAAFFGIGAIPGVILGGIIGGGTGCGIAGIFFPQQGSAAFNSFVNSTGPLGDFLKALAVDLQYFGPLLNFLSDSATYEFQLLSLAPEIGAFLFPLQALTVIWLFYTIALYVRGIGTTGA